MRKINLNGIPLSVFSKHELEERIQSLAEGTKLSTIFTINAEIYSHALRNADYKKILSLSALNTVDGMGVVVLSKLRRNEISLNDRITGPDLANIILANAHRNDRAVLILVPSNSFSAPDAILRGIHTSFPGLACRVVVEGTEEIRILQQWDPEVLFVTFGAPRQEQWINNNSHHLTNVRIAAGVGGTFDFLSGRIRRAPMWVRSLGMEGFWRILREPKRIKRALITTARLTQTIFRK